MIAFAPALPLAFFVVGRENHHILISNSRGIMIRFSPAFLVLVFPLALCADVKNAGTKEEKKPVVFTSKEGKFSVTLPDKPTEKKNKVTTSSGEVEAHLFLVDLKDRAFLVSYNDYKAGTVDAEAEKVLAKVVEGSTKNTKGKLAKDEKITIGPKKHPGHEIVIELPEKRGLYRARIYLVGERLYQVVAFGTEEFVKSKAVDDYLMSFAIQE